jgi:hypothetical protein
VFADSENKLRNQLNSVFYDLKDNLDLPENERTIGRLEDEGSLLIMAGMCLEVYPFFFHSIGV